MQELPLKKTYPLRELVSQMPKPLMRLAAYYTIDGQSIVNNAIFDREKTGYSYGGREDGQFSESTRRIAKIAHCFNIYNRLNITEEPIRKLKAYENFLEQLLSHQTFEDNFKDDFYNTDRQIYSAGNEKIAKSQIAQIVLQKLSQKLVEVYQQTPAFTNQKLSQSCAYRLIDDLLEQLFCPQDTIGTPVALLDRETRRAGSCNAVEVLYAEHPDSIKEICDPNYLYDKVVAITKTTGEPNAISLVPLTIGSITYPAGSVFAFSTTKPLSNQSQVSLNTCKFEFLRLSAFALPAQERTELFPIYDFFKLQFTEFSNIYFPSQK